MNFTNDSLFFFLLLIEAFFGKRNTYSVGTIPVPLEATKLSKINVKDDASLIL